VPSNPVPGIFVALDHGFDLLLKPVPPTEFLLEVGKMVNVTSRTDPTRPLPSSRIAATAGRGGSASHLHKQLAIGME
jgi:hypothetical protein